MSLNQSGGPLKSLTCFSKTAASPARCVMRRLPSLTSDFLERPIGQPQKHHTDREEKFNMFKKIFTMGVLLIIAAVAVLLTPEVSHAQPYFGSRYGVYQTYYPSYGYQSFGYPTYSYYGTYGY